MPTRPTIQKRTPTPKSQAAHNAEAIDNLVPAETAPAEVATPRKSTAKKSTARKSAPRTRAPQVGTRPSDPPPGTRSVSLYWPEAIHEGARSAYVYQFTQGGDERETSMPRWIGAALVRYADMTPQQRRQATKDMPQKWDGSRISRTYHIPAPAYDRMEAARKDESQWVDADGTVRVPLRSPFTVEALWVAIQATKARAGGELPRFVGRVPSLPGAWDESEVWA